jgi:type II secretory pathway pseudopilin PulG
MSVVSTYAQGSKFRASKGFTLIEVAIVFMISTLFMVLVLKGLHFINIAKERQLEGDFSNIPLMIYAYQDKYKAVPGDDSNAVRHFLGNETVVQNGDGEGLIAGTWFDFKSATDSALIWQHLRLAGLMSGDANLLSSDYVPKNALGKPIDIHSSSDSANAPIVGLNGHELHGTYIICSRGVPGALAISLDTRLDDGNPGTGNMLSTPDVDGFSPGALSATVATNTSRDISSDKNYIVCLAV